MTKNFILSLLILVPSISFSQETAIFNGEYENCEGFILDTGLSFEDSGNNENFVLVICPSEGEEVVSIHWIIFNLGEGDTMTIYDGDNTSETIFGVYTGTEVQDADFFPGENNTSGCITIEFNSDDEGVGNFVAQVSCGYPCAAPIPIVSTNENQNPILICQGETIDFDATESTVSDGFEIVEWNWDWGNGIEESTGPIASHSYPEPGGYAVFLDITDNNGCSNTEIIDLIVQVSTTPNFNQESEVEICLGEVDQLIGNFEPTEWNGTIGPNFGGELFLPDDQTTCFESEIIFTDFPTGSLINSPDDFEHFYVNLEHSFIGDLIITFICPNGQSLIAHEQGGGVTSLGEPILEDEGNPIPGIGYDYFWSPSATNGTWAEEGNGLTLPSDIYASAQPWETLEGCPLNGVWKIEVCDLFNFDNGFIFDWAIEFDSSFYPEPIVFTPSIGLDCDSSFFDGPWIDTFSDDCNEIEITPQEAGVFDYSYTVADNFGCEYSSNIQVTVLPGPSIEIVDPIIFCGNDLGLTTELADTQTGETYVFEWQPTLFLDDPTAQNPNLVNIDSDTIIQVTVYPEDSPECSNITIASVDYIEPFTIFEPFDEVICSGEELGIGSFGETAGFDYLYEWTFIPDDDPNDVQIVGIEQGLNVDEAGIYQVEVTMDGPCFYTASSEIEIEIEACEITFYNVVSPNNDQQNDFLVIEGITSLPNSTVQVYNRWGVLVFESLNYKNNWYPDVESGVYYMIVGLNKDGGMEYHELPLTIFSDK